MEKIRKNSRSRCPYQQGSLFGDDESAALMTGGINTRGRSRKRLSELDTPLEISNDTGSFRFISFGSGSSGNCSYIGNEHGGFLIDAGVDIKTVLAEMEKNNIRPESLLGICLTHDHGDHIRYAYSFLRRYRTMALYCTNRAFNGLLRRHNISRRIKDYHHAIYKEIPFNVGDFEVTAFDVPHDGSCNSGFSITYGDANFVLATDLGSVTDRARHYMSLANYLVIESNYDSTMLDNGSYPEYLKSRIRAGNGHMDNAATAAFLKEIASERLKYVYLCHLSHDNNTPDTARSCAMKALQEAGLSVGEGTESLTDNAKDVQLVVLPRFDASRCYKFHVNLK